jgi:heterotetrameric sarcosine oxidase gamma subunit
MRDRGAFWTPVVDWSSARVDRADVRIEVAAGIEQILLVGGDVGMFLSGCGRPHCLGPRDEAEGASYALCLAPDRMLAVSEIVTPVDLGWNMAGYAVADMTDGIIAIDVTGPGALALMQQGTSYDLTAGDARPGESANIVFAGLRVSVVRRGDGYRLHIERPMATALWTWLVDASSLPGA